MKPFTSYLYGIISIIISIILSTIIFEFLNASDSLFNLIGVFLLAMLFYYWLMYTTIKNTIYQFIIKIKILKKNEKSF
jgi:hypothetical protein